MPTVLVLKYHSLQMQEYFFKSFFIQLDVSPIFLKNLHNAATELGTPVFMVGISRLR